MYQQQVEFQAEPSATVAGQWIGVVRDGETGRVRTQTGDAFPRRDRAIFEAKLKWNGRSKPHGAMAGAAA